ncbi:NAD-dependent epimerase/dehydratase family protein [Geomonas edaphica]|uniref:NAD-dependent epimerase/dehydratase family protein n=1 Tax=Geomonas edaphica TaxID=2570226 RepID=UPI0010A836D7|nr:NAD-dependent epimerase/dehydratase family protein [Geomonas edaphica]
MYRKILVTGGTAVAGSALKSIHTSEYPDRDFVFIGSRDCNLLDSGATLDFIRQVKPDAIIHFAAISGGIGLSIKHPASILRDNVLLNFNVIEAARLYGVKKTVMTLTTGMYPPDAPLPLKESCIHDGPPHGSNYGSSFAKRLVEPMVRAYREEYGMNVIGLVPNGIFGENDNFNEDDAPMVPTLIRRFYENRDTDAPITLWGDGSPLREYTYAKDVARAFMWCLDNYDEDSILHTGTTEELSVKDMALLIAEFTGVDSSRIVFDTSKSNGIYRKNSDNSRFVSLSGFRYTPFKDGLRETVRWFRETMESAPHLIRTAAKSTALKGAPRG